MNLRRIVSGITAVFLASVVLAVSVPVTTYAGSNIDLKKRVVGVAGIMNVDSGLNDIVPRSEFAQMLVKASKYRDILTTTSNISIFSDVAAGSPAASAIRISAEHDWMSAFLGGLFKPDQGVTLSEAEKGLLGLLGYTSSDFAGDQYNMRHAKASSLDMLENVDKTSTDQLTKTDCIYLFYNLLRCESTDGKDYVTVLGGTLGSDGEVDATSFSTDNSLKGPKFYRGTTGLQRFISWLPFSASDASLYVNGDVASYESVKSLILGEGAVCYYNANAKVVWTYSVDGTLRNGKGAVRGEITAIQYNSTSTLTPSGVEIDGTMYRLDTSDMQFAFGIYGSCKVGEKVTIIYNAIEDDDTYAGSVVDYIYDE